ncbi:MAG: homocysteine S-methyltransferase family protein, partial [Verrucomicrobiota bacterium]
MKRRLFLFVALWGFVPLTDAAGPHQRAQDKPNIVFILTDDQGSVDAGSDIFLTNTFGANASRLKLHNAEGDVAKLNRLAVELAREVADAAGRKVYVAGSVG